MSFTQYAVTISNLKSIMGDETLRTEYYDVITFCSNSLSQLAGYGDIQQLLAETMVNSESQLDTSFIVSQDSWEEMVFHMQGIILKVALPPHARKYEQPMLDWKETISSPMHWWQLVLLTLLYMVNKEDVVVLPTMVDPHNMLSKELQPNKFSFTENSKMSLEKYNWTSDGQIHIGQIINIGISFCLCKHGNGMSFVQHLDSMALMSTMGAPVRE
ncbi:uncharacterized protein EV420DRAFT_1485550 [Desarmillaria tabescens]|uniref:Uncharacterized protein n=1 Tax=Armillaria tabescens TaxID=1929756 RepID=A0AA39JFB1_ARMTA|nr:uncharacterized protein EV420DRAFT_1485550 [Desarmillaria tabescens]KAK0441715.1 hypothetical protein EV420DRAFT_1485550 [Desarmillaria tabescens]